MGFHVCEFCQAEASATPAHSAGDVTLRFADGQAFQVPDMIVHYVCGHFYKPPDEFIDAVVYGKLVPGEPRSQSKSLARRRKLQDAGEPVKVGYLTGSVPLGDGKLSLAFVCELVEKVRIAAALGAREQTREI